MWIMDKELELLDLVIDHFVKKGSPIGSKFLYSSGDIDWAPSTIRKYLNSLEKKGLVYQPHTSAGRLPTVKWLDQYISHIEEKWLKIVDYTPKQIERFRKRDNLRGFVEMLWDVADGVTFGFFSEDDYYFLWVGNLLKKAENDMEQIIPFMDFLEKKRIVTYLKDKKIATDKVTYNFIWYENITVASMYIKTSFDKKDAIVGVVWPLRLDYKKNIAIMNKFLVENN